jgi:hypothetical protein
MESLPDDLKSVLGPNEQVQAYIRQKIYHPKINIDSVLITNQRIILRHPHALGLRKDYTDYNYQDISNVVLDKGILRSTIKCTLRFGGDPLELSGLPNSDAEKAYGLVRDNLVKFQSPMAAMAMGVPPARQPTSPTGFSSASCTRCGSPLVAGQKFCGNCGLQV